VSAAAFRLILPFLGQTPLAIDFAVPITKARTDYTQLISFSLGFTNSVQPFHLERTSPCDPVI